LPQLEEKMRFRKRILVCFLALFLLSNISFAQKGDKIRLTISLDKEVYLTREPIWLNMTAVNISDTVQEIYALMPEASHIEIILKDSNGNQLPYYGMWFDYTSGSGPRTMVKPDTAFRITGSYNLLDGFGERINALPRHFLKPNKYTVKALYRGRVYSNTLEFTVEAPQGDEEKACELLAEGINHPFMSDRSELVAKLKELVTKYPKSVYVDIAYHEMLFLDQDKERAKENAKELISNYPNSWMVYDALMLLVRGEEREKRRLVLQEWMDRFPGTKTEESAKQILKWIDNVAW
jgi:hypothetical protein